MEDRLITVKREDALEKVRENRSKHALEYQEALSGYKSKLEQRLASELQRLNDTDADKAFTLDISNLTAPQHNLKDYDRYISILEWEIDDEVDLSMEEFARLIDDDWRWKNNWQQTMYFYSDRDDLR